MADSSLSVLERNIAAPAGQESNPALGAGSVNTSVVGGGVGTAVLLETGFMADKVNPIVQFNIDNSGLGNTVQTLRIGSVLGLADTYAYWGQTASAADDGVITDQFGVGVPYVQGFSDLVKSQAVIVTKIKVETPTPTLQLAQNFLYKKLQYDGTIQETTANIAYTVQKSDYRLNLVEMEAMFLLNASLFLEYKILAGSQVSIFLNLAAANTVETFKTLPAFKG